MIQGRYRKEELDASYSQVPKFIETGDYNEVARKTKQNNNQSSALTTFQSKVQSLFFFSTFPSQEEDSSLETAF